MAISKKIIIKMSGIDLKDHFRPKVLVATKKSIPHQLSWKFAIYFLSNNEKHDFVSSTFKS